MTGQRATILLAGSAMLLSSAGPAFAQGDDRQLLRALRECARIDEVTARMACYDGQLRPGSAPEVGIVARPVPPSAPPPAAVANAPSPPPAPRSRARAPAAAPPPPSGFGSEAVRRDEAASGQAERFEGRITAIAQREPGIYRMTLEDGAEWQFSADSFYDPPAAGATIRIERGSLGSFMMVYRKQAGVRVIRLR
jgi:hypothetical protein